MADSQLPKLVSGVDSSGRLSKTAGIVLLMKSPRRSNVAARRTSACCRSYDSLEKAVVAVERDFIERERETMPDSKWDPLVHSLQLAGTGKGLENALSMAFRR